MLSFQEVSIERAIAEKLLKLSWEPRVSANPLKMSGVHGTMQMRSADGGWINAESAATFSANQLSAIWKWKLSQMKEVFSCLLHHKTSKVPGDGISISLSLLPKQLYSDEWAVQLLDTASDVGIPGGCIEIELIEHGDSINSLYVDWSFEALRNSGICLTLANFPCGWLHLQRLVRHDFDKVIINSSLLPGANEPPAAFLKRKALLNGVIYTIHTIGAAAVFDRIENDLQFRLFSELEVAEGRGPYLGAPVDTHEIPHLMLGLQKPSTKIRPPLILSDA